MSLNNNGNGQNQISDNELFPFLNIPDSPFNTKIVADPFDNPSCRIDAGLIRDGIPNVYLSEYKISRTEVLSMGLKDLLKFLNMLVINECPNGALPAHRELVRYYRDTLKVYLEG